MFKDLKLKDYYSTDEENVLASFYLPVLMSSRFYFRASGYFSTSLFNSCFDGLAHFYNNGGKIHLVIGSVCSQDDLDQIRDAEELKKIITEKLLREVSDIDLVLKLKPNSYTSKKISLFSFLLAQGVIEIKVAQRTKGIYHEKIAIYVDELNDMISTQGSANETLGAFEANHESFDVFKKWEARDSSRVARHLNNFEKLWHEKANDTLVIGLPEAVRKNLLKVCAGIPLLSTKEELDYLSRSAQVPTEFKYNSPCLPILYKGKPFKLKPHQEDAIKKFQDNGCRSILQLCTGAGKTLTSIYFITKYYQKYSRELSKNLFCIIVVPYLNLAEQWFEELLAFNIYPIDCHSASSKDNWRFFLQGAISEHVLLTNQAVFNCAIVVKKTFISNDFQNQISLIKGGDLIVVADEVHNYEKVPSSFFPERAKIRLGLSATIYGCKNIQNYFSDNTYVFSLKDAIERDILCKYRYSPYLIRLSTKETEDYFELQQSISKLEAILNDSDTGERTALDILYSKRSNLLGNAAEKICKLKEIISKDITSFKNCLFYCSSTVIDDEMEDDASDSDQVDNVSELLDSLSLTVSKYTAKIPLKNRKNILREFKEKGIDCLVAIRCLDEGVDIPAVKSAFLISSSSNPKQFIQRRGRVLRKSSDKEIAYIYDFFVLPSAGNEANPYSQRLAKQEIIRMKDFASLATNKAELFKILETLAIEYNLNFDNL